jgi:putative flippase GtrA
MILFRSIRQSAEFLRFLLVAVVGLLVDISLAWGLSTLFGVNLVLAAATGFACGAAFNYLLHEFWTFRRTERRLSLARMLRYVGALGATLATRLAVVYTLSQFLTKAQSDIIILLLATILSFAVNHLVSKRFVFRPAASSKTAGKGPRP